MVNKVTLIGRLGSDPEVKKLDNGNAVANFSLATSEKYKDKQGNKQENTEWHNIVLWGRLAEIAEKYLEKGKQVYIEGKISTRSWDDQDGNKKYRTEIVGYSLQMLGGGESSDKPQAKQSAPQTVDGGRDDLPF